MKNQHDSYGLPQVSTDTPMPKVKPPKAPEPPPIRFINEDASTKVLDRCVALIFSLLVIGVIMTASIKAESAILPSVDFVGGQYHIYINGVRQTKPNEKPLYFNIDTTAKKYAANLSFMCNGCLVIIKQPDIKVTTTITVIDDPTEPPIVDEPTDLTSILLTWGRPSERVNGDALSVDDIKGYVIVILVNGVAGDTILVSGLNHTLTDLPPGAYTFKMATQTNDDVIGPFSELSPEVII